MLFVLGGYAVLVWLIFFQFKLLPWNTLTKIVVSLVGLFILLFFISLLNTRVPSGRFTVIVPVSGSAPVVSGTVKEVAIASGQRVEDGELLYALDERPFQFALDQAEANLRLAEQTYLRIETAIEKNPATFSRQQRDEAQAGFEAANAAVDTARYKLERTRIVAVGDGTVALVEVRPGDRIAAFTPVIGVMRTEFTTIAGIFDQNGRRAIETGAQVGIAPRNRPGTIHWTTINHIQSSGANAQTETGGRLLGSQDIGDSTEIVVEFAWPETLPKDTRPGLVGTAMVIGDDAGAIGGLGKILLWIKAMFNYL